MDLCKPNNQGGGRLLAVQFARVTVTLARTALS